MPYIKTTNGTATEYTLAQLRSDNSNTSFPESMPSNVLAAYDVYEYTISDRPAYDGDTQYLSEAAFVQGSDGNWSRGWVVNNLGQSVAEKNVRATRNELLADSDWTVLSDSPLSDADKLLWETYRTNLRNLTDQGGFPFSVTYPTKP